MIGGNAESQRQFDEAMTALIDIHPRMWRSMYLRLVEEGFNESQSLELVKVFILSQCPSGIRGTD